VTPAGEESFCRQCFAPLASDQEYCLQCGARREPPPEPSWYSSLIFVGSFLVVGSLLALGYLLLTRAV
jgi:predicted amidophosphoribosyltransferase